MSTVINPFLNKPKNVANFLEKATKKADEERNNVFKTFKSPPDADSENDHLAANVQKVNQAPPAQPTIQSIPSPKLEPKP